VHIFLHFFFSNVIEYEYGNKIIENWYFKSLVKRAKKREKKTEIESEISRILNRNKYAVAYIRTHYEEVSVQSLIRLAYAGKRCYPHVMRSISVGKDAIISTYVNGIMECHLSSSPSTLRSRFFFSLFYYLYLVCETRKYKNKTDWCDDLVYRLIFYLTDFLLLSLSLSLPFFLSLFLSFSLFILNFCSKAWLHFTYIAKNSVN